jgi:hypothetical protein
VLLELEKSAYHAHTPMRTADAIVPVPKIRLHVAVNRGARRLCISWSCVVSIDNIISGSKTPRCLFNAIGDRTRRDRGSWPAHDSSVPAMSTNVTYQLASWRSFGGDIARHRRVRHRPVRNVDRRVAQLTRRWG